MALNIIMPKGKLYDSVDELLRKIGINFSRESKRSYSLFDLNHESIKGTLIKLRGIPQLMETQSKYDIGFCGDDLITESDSQIVKLLNLQLNKVKIVVAAKEAKKDILINQPKRALIIASEYFQTIAPRWAYEKNISAVILPTYGSTESYLLNSDADLIIECVETGNTLRENGAVILEEIMTSSTQVITTERAMERNRKVIEVFLKTIKEAVYGKSNIGIL